MPASALARSDSSSAHNVITRVFDSAGFQSLISPRKPELSRSQGRSWSRTISRPRSCCSWVVWRAWRRASTVSFYTVTMPFVSRLVIAWAINLAALWAANAIWDGVQIEGWKAYLIGSAVLGIANAVLKPLLTVLTLPLIIITLGFFYLLINIAMIALAEWIAPNFSIDGFWSYVGTVVVVWAVNWIGDQVLGNLASRARPRLI